MTSPLQPRSVLAVALLAASLMATSPASGDGAPTSPNGGAVAGQPPAGVLASGVDGVGAIERRLHLEGTPVAKPGAGAVGLVLVGAPAGAEVVLVIAVGSLPATGSAGSAPPRELVVIALRADRHGVVIVPLAGAVAGSSSRIVAALVRDHQGWRACTATPP